VDLAAHPCLLIVDLRVGCELWQVVNFYNDVKDPMVLQALWDLDLSTNIPTLLVGDFNTHSLLWSPPGWAASPRVDWLEWWVATNTLELLTILGVPTRRGQEAQNQWDSTLDLVWRNFAAQVKETFQGASIDWPGSMGLDHTLIQILVSTPYHIRRPRTECSNCFNIDIKPDKWK
jgi:hypothetical protein